MLSFQAPGRSLPFALALFAIALWSSGCGSEYRPVITPVPPSGPPSQPAAYAAVVSAPGTPSTSTQGVVSVLDYSGDSIMAQASVGLGPVGLATDSVGTTGYSLNADNTVSQFAISSSLLTRNIETVTLPADNASRPISALYALPSLLYALDTATNSVDVLVGTLPAFRLSVPVARGPITMAGVASGQRIYVVSQGVDPGPLGSGTNCDNPAGVATAGTLTAIETASYRASATVPLGVCPVFSAITPDGWRIFVMNRGSGTVTVYDGQGNAPDTQAPVISVGAGPVYAAIDAVHNLLVTANYDAGTVSVIDIRYDQYGKDLPSFGTVLATIPVGVHPAAVTILADGSRAYVANEGTVGTGAAEVPGSASIIDLTTMKVTKTIDLGTANPHPRLAISTQNSLYGKVYMSGPDSSGTGTGSQFVTIIRTDEDIVSTSIRIQGPVIDVHTTSPNGQSGSVNPVISSRIPGSGQP